VNYTFLDNPSVSRNYLLYFDDTDRIERQHFIRFGMENRLQTRNSDKSIRTLLSLENYWDLYFRDHAGFGNVEEFNRIGNFCTVLTASPLKGLTLSTSFNIDFGSNNEDMPEVERRSHRAGRPGVCAKWLNRWNATVSYEIVEDVILNLTYDYKRPYSARSSYSMGSTLHQFDAGGFFDKYFDNIIILASFINSDGCIEKEPIPIQLLAPPLTTPMPGIKTSTSNIKPIIYI
jgi:hypothetical protein